MQKTSTTLRSHCPITTGIDVIGDKWTLLIIRHMLFRQKYTYGQLLEMKEKIATKVLAARLVTMVADDLIEKRPLKDILVKTRRILLKPSPQQKNTLLIFTCHRNIICSNNTISRS